jgi:hypothetical protein
MSWPNDGPTEDTINALCEITGIDRNQAISRLKANNNNADRAASEYFDDPSGKKVPRLPDTSFWRKDG